MAKHDNNWTPDTDEAQAPADAPKTRDNIVQENRQKAHHNPAAAPEAADAEAGAHVSPSGVPLTPRTEPVRSHVVNASSDPGNVRAGPGDAGAQDRPDRATQPSGDHNTGWGRALFIVALVLLVGLAVSIVAMP